ncbi:MAG TPA: glycosyltransferase family 39 protein [Planctomycetota bacterium]|nr:glycosyltransferase family 39 protein [Planctomycetota bacterium]
MSSAPRGGRTRTEAILDSAAVAVLWAALFLAGRWRGSLHGDALRYAAVAKDLAARGDLTDPRFAGEPYWNKPPLVLALSALSIHAFGPNRFGAAFPVALFSLGTMWVTGAIGRRFLGRAGGWVAAVALGTTPLLVRHGSDLRLDPPLAFFTAGALAAVLFGAERRRLLPLFGACVGLGFLAKGPGALAPIGAVALLSLLGRTRFPWDRRGFWVGIAIGLGVALPWFVAMRARHGEAFVSRFFGAEFAGRFAGEWGRKDTPLHYGPWLLEGTVPWCVVAAAGLVALRRRARFEDRRLARFLLAWSVSGLAPLLFVRPPYARYLVSTLPCLALLAGRGALPWLEGSRFAALRLAAGALAVLGAVGACAGAIPVTSRAPRDLDRVAAAVRGRGPNLRILAATLPGEAGEVPTGLRACLDFHFGLRALPVAPDALASLAPRFGDLLVIHKKARGTPSSSWRRSWQGETYALFEPSGG